MKFKKLHKNAPNTMIYFNEEEKELLENYVSYNATANNGKCETALRYNGRFYILNGDLRKECEKCKDIEEVRELFLKSDLEVSSRSNDFVNL